MFSHEVLSGMIVSFFVLVAIFLIKVVVLIRKGSFVLMNKRLSL
jgi:hypothetical protein